MALELGCVIVFMLMASTPCLRICSTPHLLPFQTLCSPNLLLECPWHITWACLRHHCCSSSLLEGCRMVIDIPSLEHFLLFSRTRYHYHIFFSFSLSALFTFPVQSSIEVLLFLSMWPLSPREMVRCSSVLRVQSMKCTTYATSIRTSYSTKLVLALTTSTEHLFNTV